MKQSVSSQYRPASGAQVVDQTALEAETMAQRTHDITAGRSTVGPPAPTTHLGHVLGDNEQAAVLLHNHAEQLHQVVVSKLPAREGEPGDVSLFFTRAQQNRDEQLEAYVMTEASAMKACAVASFLMHLTATLDPR